MCGSILGCRKSSTSKSLDFDSHQNSVSSEVSEVPKTHVCHKPNPLGLGGMCFSDLCCYLSACLVFGVIFPRSFLKILL